MAARSPPRSEPTNSQAFLPRATARSSRSAELFVRQIRPSARKVGEAFPVVEEVGDRLGNGIVAREAGARRVHPGLQLSDDGRGSLLANGKPLGGRLAADVALDGKEPIDYDQRLGCQGRDERRRTVLALLLLLDVDELEELPAAMCPAVCARHRLLDPAVAEQVVEAGKPVDLEDPAIAG